MLEFGECDNSDTEDYSLPDDFPEGKFLNPFSEKYVEMSIMKYDGVLELNMEPLSPGRPLTLDPETGKRLMRAEGEPTPQPTPEPSPEPSPVPSPIPTTQVLLKEEKDTLVSNVFRIWPNRPTASIVS